MTFAHQLLPKYQNTVAEQSSAATDVANKLPILIILKTVLYLHLSCIQ